MRTSTPPTWPHATSWTHYLLLTLGCTLALLGIVVALVAPSGRSKARLSA